MRIDVIAGEAREMIKRAGLGRIGFLTLTYAEALEYWECQERWNSLRTNIISKRYSPCIIGLHLSPMGRWHWHGIVTCQGQILDDQTDVQAIMDGHYGSANPWLREEWRFLREVCPKYGFGRHQLVPIIKTAEHAAVYLASELGRADDQLTGKRRVRFVGLKGKRSYSMQRGWVSGSGGAWRDAVRDFCKYYGIVNQDDMLRRFGKRWAFKLKDWIQEFYVSQGGGEA